MRFNNLLKGSVMVAVSGLVILSVIGANETQATTVAKEQGNTKIGNIQTSESVRTKKETQTIEDYTMYGIGSVSKMFGTVAVMQLVDAGKIDLDAPLVQYIPDFEMADERYQAITPRMLLNHTSGIMGTVFSDAMLIGDTNPHYKQEVLERLKTQNLKADPGAYSVYCNDGFTLAEILVERVSGMDFTTYVREEIAMPLHMQNTKTPLDDFNTKKLEKTYYLGMETPTEAISPIASGGIYSTVEDLCKFSSVFMAGENDVLSEKAKEDMAKAWYLQDSIGVLEGESGLGYGLGWDSVNTYPYEQYGIKALTKGGDSILYHSSLTVLPEEGIAMAVNASGGKSGQLQLMAQEVLLEVLKEEGLLDEVEPEHLYTKKEKQAIPSQYKAYAGIYQSSNMIEVSFGEDETMMLTSIDSEYPVTQVYDYNGEGVFVSQGGQYITMAGLKTAENGSRGESYLRFSEESNGRTYFSVTTYETVAGLGDTAITMPIAEKITPNKLDAQTMKAWDARNHKKYFPVAERYSDLGYVMKAYTQISLLDEVPGYTKSASGFFNTKIIDANTSVCDIQIPGMVGRDLTNYHFYKEGEIEYLQAGANLYMAQDGVQSSSQLQGNITLGATGHTKWYEIDQKDAGKEISIVVPTRGAYFVYNDEGVCIASSHFKENKKSVVLPEGGYIALVGEVGTTFKIAP